VRVRVSRDVFGEVRDGGLRCRHVGDLGNVLAERGVVETTITDRRVSLFGRHSVIGKSIVVSIHYHDLNPNSVTLSGSKLVRS